MTQHCFKFPKLHNAAWPGVVGKGGDGNQPPIGLDEMLDLTAAADCGGVKFDGFDLFLYSPHIDIDAAMRDDGVLYALADKATARGLTIGSVVAPIWPPTGGGAAMGDDAECAKFLAQVRKGCYVAKRLREVKVRPHGVVRIDSASNIKAFLADPDGNLGRIARTFREACIIAEDNGERLAAEGEVCWGGMHTLKLMVRLLEAVDRPQTLGFQADMAHTLMYMLGTNGGPDDRLLPQDFIWSDSDTFDSAYRQLVAALQPWTIDFHVAQNDGTVHGTGSHDDTGRHCLPGDPNGKLDIVKLAGWWLRDSENQLTKRFAHVCWDGCMFPNEVLMNPETWNSILGVMVEIRQQHGWN